MKKKAESRYLFVDTETGGIDPTKHSLLSIGCAVWENGKGILATKELFIKNDEYIFTKEAIKINKFRVNEHEEKAMYPKETIDALLDFLYAYFDKETAIPLIGHNIQFDVSFIKEFFRSNNRSFERIFSHRIIDTYSIYKSLCIANKIKINLDSSTTAFKHFAINVVNRHSAIDDCVATVELFEKLLDLLKE